MWIAASPIRLIHCTWLCHVTCFVTQVGAWQALEHCALSYSFWVLGTLWPPCTQPNSLLLGKSLQELAGDLGHVSEGSKHSLAQLTPTAYLPASKRKSDHTPEHWVGVVRYRTKSNWSTRQLWITYFTSLNLGLLVYYVEIMRVIVSWVAESIK